MGDVMVGEVGSELEFGGRKGRDKMRPAEVEIRRPCGTVSGLRGGG